VHGSRPPRPVALHPDTRDMSVSLAASAEHELVFVYGTLKRGLPNASHMPGQYVSSAATVNPYALVVGPHGIPFMLDGVDGNPRKCVIQGEVYRVSGRELAFLDVVSDALSASSLGVRVIYVSTHFPLAQR
jgi:gamma-glutamylcyclotransferase (GGCT)/AIG2-like uncharacterized protein YtfP